MSSSKPTRRIAFLSAVDVTVRNGNLQRQLQVLRQLTHDQTNLVFIISLQSTPAKMRDWLEQERLHAQVIDTLRAGFARVWYILWYYSNSLFCTRFKFIKFFQIPPFPFEVLDKDISHALSFYLWPACIIGLQRRKKWYGRLTIDLNDVMGDRHSRTGHHSWISINPVLESQILRNPGIDCVAITPDDADLFNTAYGVRPRVWPFFPSESFCKLPIAVNRPRAIGYFAAKNTQNIEIISFLIEHNIVKAWVDLGLIVVLAGSGCDSLPDNFRRNFIAQGGELIGRVKSVEEFYGRVQVALNPIGPSTGVKIKSVEALVYGCNLVTSPWGTDSLLNEFFGDHLHVISWPLNAAELVKAGMLAVCHSRTESTLSNNSLCGYKALVTKHLLLD